LRHVKGVGIFAMKLPRPRVVYIDDVRLVYASPWPRGRTSWGRSSVARRGVDHGVYIMKP